MAVLATNKKLVALLLFSFLLVLPLVSATDISTELINYSGFVVGNVADWVELVQANGMTEFTIRIAAYSEYHSIMSMNEENRAKELITAADAAGLTVNVDIHTWYTTWDNDFDDDGSNVAANRADMIEFIQYVISHLDDTAVGAFMVLNEPQAQTASTAENNFILDCISAGQAATDKPISVRFMCGYSPSTGHYAEAIDTASDFICRNSYWDAQTPATEVYGATQAKLETAISTAHTQSKEFWLTECGSSGNEAEQAAYTAAIVEYAKTAGIDKLFGWVSQPSSTGESYNYFDGHWGTRDGWYELINDGGNLAGIPDDWTTAYTGMHFGIGGVDNVVYDTSVQHNGHNSIRLDPIGETDNVAREANSYSYDLTVGQTIIFSGWFKTSAPAGGETDRGARFGVDLYGSGGRITAVQTPTGATWSVESGYPATEDNQFVGWGSDWTYREMQFTINGSYVADPFAGGTNTEGNSYVPTDFIPWIQCCSNVDGGQAWYADLTLTLTDGDPEPTATPTPVPTAAPQPTELSAGVNPMYILLGCVGLLFVAYQAIKGKR